MRTSDLAVALLAGLLQRLGAQHRNEAMIDAGKRLAEHITSADAVAPNQGKGECCLRWRAIRPPKPTNKAKD